MLHVAVVRGRLQKAVPFSLVFVCVVPFSTLGEDGNERFARVCGLNSGGVPVGRRCSVRQMVILTRIFPPIGVSCVFVICTAVCGDSVLR